jgi:Ca-activated chloride channel family protein
VVEASYVVPAEGIDIVLAVDTSSSMTQTDFGGSTRMDATKKVVIDFLGGLKNDRAGIVIFSAEAMILSPLTLDYKAAQRLMQPVEAGRLLRDGTAIGTGLATALNAVRGSSARSKVVVLLTDGQNNTGDITPLDAATMAKVLGIRVYTIGAVGGPRVSSEIDEQLMRRMAQESGGQYYRAGDEAALRNVYREIEALEKARVGSRGFIETHDATLPFLALGAGLLVLEVLLVTTAFRRTP